MERNWRVLDIIEWRNVNMKNYIQYTILLNKSCSNFMHKLCGQILPHFTTHFHTVLYFRMRVFLLNELHICFGHNSDIITISKVSVSYNDIYEDDLKLFQVNNLDHTKSRNPTRRSTTQHIAADVTSYSM